MTGNSGKPWSLVDEPAYQWYQKGKDYEAISLEELLGYVEAFLWGHQPEKALEILKSHPLYDLDTLMEFAVFGEHLDAIRFLAGQGVDKVALNTALRSAAEKGSLSTVDVLMEAEADDVDGALIEAAGRGNIEMMRWLRNQYGATAVEEALKEAKIKGQYEAVRYLEGKE